MENHLVALRECSNQKKDKTLGEKNQVEDLKE